MKLRKYQQESIDTINNFLIKNNEGILSLPTGSGKTFTATSWAYNNRSTYDHLIWVCHREELKKQALEALKSFFNKDDICLWDAKTKPKNLAKIIIVMIQSCRKFNFTRLVNKTNYIIVDEAHHIEAKTYNNFVNSLKYSFLLHLTATPKENYKKKIPIIYEKSFKDLVSLKYLAKPRYISVKTNLQYVLSVRGGDFTSGSLNQLDDPKRNEIIFNHWKKNKISYGKIIIFCTTVAQATSLYDKFYKELLNSDIEVFFITGLLPKLERELLIQRYSESKNGIMINISVFTEGFDDKTIDTVFICRPTLSRTLYLQMIGRGCRILDKKLNFNIVDFVDCIKRYEISRNNFINDLIGYYPDPELASNTKKDNELLSKKKQLKEANLNRLIIKNETSVIDIIGWLEFSNKFVYNKQLLFTKFDSDLLVALYYSFKNDNIINIKEFINQAYGEIGFNSSFNFNQWKNICWSIIMYIKNNSSICFKLNYLNDQDKPKKSNIKTYSKLSRSYKLNNIKLNNLWKNKEKIIFNNIINKIDLEYNDKNIINSIIKYCKPISYKDKIYTIYIKNSKSFQNINYHNVGVSPGFNTLRMWKRLFKTFLIEEVNDDSSEAIFTFTEPS